jgi:phage terminase large subunit
MEINADFPEKLQFLFQPMRYKVARGGRYSGKSWGFARAVLILGAIRPIRILCTREVQRSIDDSVHTLLKDQIKLLGLDRKYRVTDKKIFGNNGTKILYSGLLQHTILSIKSYENIDICWVEEGQAVSEKSWKILTPTIRGNGPWGGKKQSEIWVSYNPDLETDPTHQRFTIDPPENCINVLMNYTDNPWFDDVGEMERQECYRKDPEGYPNIWEGRCRPAVEGAIYYKQIEQAELENRICDVPYDSMLKVHVVVDIGFNDDTSIGMFQKVSSEYRLIDYIEGHQQTWDEYNTELRKRSYNWGKMWLPHDGYAKRIEAHGKSSAMILRKLGWDVPKKDEVKDFWLGVEEGIKLTRLNFHRLKIDKTRCAAFIEHMKRYRRHINQTTEAAGAPIHDDHSHAPDMLRGFMVCASQMRNEDERPVFKHTPPQRSAYAL